MWFEWDERKRQANIAKHALDFRRAVQVVDGPSFSYRSPGPDEERWVTVGKVHGRLVAVVWLAIGCDPCNLDEEGEA
jgi:uncharacterized protein